MALTPRRAFAATLLALSAVPWSAGGQAPEIPIVPGVHFVLAVNNHIKGADPAKNIREGDYEMVVAITGVTPESVTQTAYIEILEPDGGHHRLAIPRIVNAADLETSRVQVLGFHSEDPVKVSGTTSLGPSRGVIRALVDKGETAYSFLNFVSHGMVSGTLRRAATPVRFPVLLNGRRVELPAIHATGQMSLGGVTRPFETIILDHPRFPLSLRVSYGPRGAAFPFEPEFAREIVRIDVPEELSTKAAAATLARECRMEVPGIYFDFNRSTLKPESKRGLADMAAILRQVEQRPFVIEGHTDGIGADGYNDALSARRADAVKTALIQDYGIDGGRLSTAGFGERKPIESNETLAGRARNRRVELACAPSTR
jgi:outer membrane protein OmpA-like peptidoglycan-associated protein